MVISQNRLAHVTDNSNEQPDSRLSWLTSLTFWLMLLIAAVAYGLVALSPKLLTFVRLRHDYQTTQVRLVVLEYEVTDLQQVVDALEHDPEFIRKLAIVDFGAHRAGEDRIPVDASLQLDARDNAPVFALPANSLPWYSAILEAFATNSHLRRTTLFASALVIVLAFSAFTVPSSDPSTSA